MATSVELGALFLTASGTKVVTGTPALSDLIVIITGHTANTSAAAPTDNNTDGQGTYTEVVSAQKNSSTDTLRVWIRDALIGSATSTIFTHAPGSTTGGGLWVFRVSAMTRVGAAAAAHVGAQSNQAATGTPTVVMNGTANGTNPCVAVVFNATNTAGMTEPSAFNAALNLGYGTPVTGIASAWDDTGFASNTVTWGSTSASAFCSVAVELDASAGAPTGGVGPLVNDSILRASLLGALAT